MEILNKVIKNYTQGTYMGTWNYEDDPSFLVELNNGCDFYFKTQDEIFKYVNIENNVYRIANVKIMRIIFDKDEIQTYFEVNFTLKGVPTKKQSKKAKEFLKRLQFHNDMKQLLGE